MAEEAGSEGPSERCAPKTRHRRDPQERPRRDRPKPLLFSEGASGACSSLPHDLLPSQMRGSRQPHGRTGEICHVEILFPGAGTWRYNLVV